MSTIIKNFITNNIQSQIFNNAIDSMEQRGIADLVELNITNALLENSNTSIKVTSPRSVRSIEDVLIEHDNKTYFVDIKTTDVNKKFSMPNLISIDRLRKLYKDENMYFLLVMVKYNSRELVSTDIKLIEEIGFDKQLKIQNLGKGQLQLVNAHNKITKFVGNRDEWLNTLSLNAITFYNELINKTSLRINEWAVNEV